MKMLDLSNQIKQWGIELGFQQVGITDTQLDIAEKRLEYWLAKGFHADMDYMHKHGLKRSRLHFYTQRPLVLFQ
jgi:epoxyqueuosine reductase